MKIDEIRRQCNNVLKPSGKKKRENMKTSDRKKKKIKYLNYSMTITVILHVMLSNMVAPVRVFLHKIIKVKVLGLSI